MKPNKLIPSPTHPPVRCVCRAITPNLPIVPKKFGCSVNTQDLTKLKSKASTKKKFNNNKLYIYIYNVWKKCNGYKSVG